MVRRGLELLQTLITGNLRIGFRDSISVVGFEVVCTVMRLWISVFPAEGIAASTLDNCQSNLLAANEAALQILLNFGFVLGIAVIIHYHRGSSHIFHRFWTELRSVYHWGIFFYDRQCCRRRGSWCAWRRWGVSSCGKRLHRLWCLFFGLLERSIAFGTEIL